MRLSWRLLLPAFQAGPGDHWGESTVTACQSTVHLLPTEGARSRRLIPDASLVDAATPGPESTFFSEKQRHRLSLRVGAGEEL